MIEIIETKKDKLEVLIPLFKSFFKKHNIFQKDNKTILEYLKKSHQENWEKGGGYITLIKDNKIAGAVLLSISEVSRGKHLIASLKHFAMSNYPKKTIYSSLLSEIDLKIALSLRNQKLKSAKLEAKLSSLEKDAISIFKKNKFKKQGVLKDHYDIKEDCIILGKIIFPQASGRRKD